MRTASALKRTLFFLFILPVSALSLNAQKSTYNFHPNLSPNLAASLSDSSTEKVSILLGFFDQRTAQAFLQSHNLSQRLLRSYPPTHLLLLSLSMKELREEVIPDERVLFADIRNTLPQEERFLSDFDGSVNRINAVRARFPTFTGQGQVVSIKENRPDSVDIDLLYRYSPSGLGTPGVSTHATTMATLIAGAGNSFHTGQGPAWQAQYTSSSFFNLLPDPETHFVYTDAWVQNHSYGVDIENYYGAEAQAYDLQVHQNPNLLHIFSAGNQGEARSEAGPYAGITGYANLSGNFKMAKNILTIGAVDSFLHIESRSSRGPAFDGRVKPELVAFGEDGSSGAAAITSGTSLLLQQAYRERHDGQVPPAALLRAALLNSAQDLGTKGPDYSYGYGNLQADEALSTLLENRFFGGSLGPGDSLSFQISVPAHVHTLKVTLAWTDPPATLNTAKALVNDLDVVLTELNTGIRWLPWVCSAFPHPDSLALPARRGRDSLNNQEQITLDAPAEGTYQVWVKAPKVLQDSQAFFLAFSFDSTRFRWRYPLATDPVQAGQKVALRWEQFLARPWQGEISCRFVGSNSWISLARQTDLSTGRYSWQVPDTFAQAQLRLRFEQQQAEYLSDTFTISPLLKPEIGFDCEEAFLLSWENKEAADSFRVYSLVNAYLEPLLHTTDTFVVLPKDVFPERYFAVSPVGNGTLEGMRSIALDREFQQAGCYIRSFFATLEGDQTLLSLSLGTTYQVEKVAFEKLQEQAFISLGEVTEVNDLTVSWQDEFPDQGSNTYRARVQLQDGKTYVSDVAEVLYVQAGNYLVGPNPVNLDEDLLIIRQGNEQASFQLFDNLGRKVWQQELIADYSPIPLFSLNRGLYAYHILEGEVPVKRGKILIW